MTVERRSTGPRGSRARRFGAALASCACLTAFAQGDGDFGIVLDDAALAGGGSELTAAWIGYGTAIIAKATSPEFRDRPMDDFAVEVYARTALAKIWSEARQPESLDPYLDKLAEIHAAGFIEEYVLVAFARPGWALSAAELGALEMDAFFDWAGAHLDGFVSVTAAGVERKTQPPSAPTGIGLPDPAAFAPSEAVCSATLPVMRSALAEWEREAAALRGAPIAAETDRQFVATLLDVAELPPYRTEGIAWVSPRPALLSYFAGFCAVEAGDLESAERWLRSATTMLPFEHDVRQELIHVLVGTGRLDAADAEVDGILAAADADDNCTLARAWRRRGYIRFEQQRWDEARAAYERSLDYQPGNELALTELELISEQIGPSNPLSPAPTTQTFVTECNSNE